MNPMYTYIIVFSGVIITYVLGWSNLYPALTLETYLFFTVSFLFSLFIGGYIKRQNKMVYKNIKKTGKEFKVVCIICVLYIVDFIYAGQIPLIIIMSGINYEYNSFNGIPLIHKWLMTFSPFYFTYLFHLFISSDNNKSKYIGYLLVCIIPAVLMFNRGMVLYMLSNIIFVYVFAHKNTIIKPKNLLIILGILVTSTYAYGALGNIRTQAQTGSEIDYTDSRLILTIGSATDKFIASKIPKEFFWGYIYATSPLANFQSSINKSNEYNPTFRDLYDFIVTEIIPDTFSHRIISNYDIKPNLVNFIRKDLTVGTMYAKAFTYMNWMGPILMYTYMVIISVAYITIVKPGNRFYVTGISTLNTMIVFNAFSNMFVFTALSLQLIYPIVFRKKILYHKKEIPILRLMYSRPGE